jgi:hypothetical protein
MNNAGSSNSPLGKLFSIIIFVGGLVGLYYLYQYLFGPRTVNSTALIPPKVQSANVTKEITLSSNSIPIIYEGGEFTISTWIYVSNWSYRTGMNKHILSIGGPTFDTIRIYLGGVTPSVQIRLQTMDISPVSNTVQSGSTATTPSLSMTSNKMPTKAATVPAENLSKATQNAVFNILQTNSGLLDGSPLCDLPQLDLQKWINLTVAVNGKTVDVYMDGKLARSCVLPSFFKVDSGGYNATLLAYGGFGGEISNTVMYDVALNPEQVYKNYMAGPEPISNLLDWFKSFFTPRDTL